MTRHITNGQTDGSAGWGKSPTPLIPEVLRKLWERDRLPTWVARDAGLSDDTTLIDLGPEMWSKVEVAPERLKNYVIALVEARYDQIRNVPVLNRPWPLSLDPAVVPWRPRTRNGLIAAGLIGNEKQLSALTFGQLRNVPHLGILSILDFACVAEIAILTRDIPDNANLQGDESALELLCEVISEPWADVVSEEDPRFADLFPLTGRGTVFQRIDALTGGDAEPAGAELRSLFDTANAYSLVALAEAVKAVQLRVRQIESQTLEVSLIDYLTAMLRQKPRVGPTALSEKDRVAAMAATTLEAAAGVIGVTRERVRQIQSLLTSRLPGQPPLMPALDRALEEIAKGCPMGERAFARSLRSKRITAIDFHPLSLIAAAEFCKRDPNFSVEKVAAGWWVSAGPAPIHSRKVVFEARSQAAAYGMSNVDEVAAAVEAEGLHLNGESISELLREYSAAEFLSDKWFWFPDGKRNRAWNQVRKMLSVYPSLELGVIREGLRRKYKFRGLSLVPPRSVLEAFFAAHPSFAIDDDKHVRSVEPLDYRSLLGAVETIFVEVLRQSPSGLLDRASFESACDARGVNHNTFSVYTTYSPILEHVSQDVWALRGSVVNPAAVEALRQSVALQPKESRYADHGWTADGRLWLAVRLSRHPESVPIHIPVAISHYVGEGRFQALTELGAPAGTVVVAKDGASWGYGPFLSRRGADEDDVLVVEFDLVKHTASLRIASAELLEAAN